MARPFVSATDAQVHAAELGLERLKEAYQLFKTSGSERTAERVRLAITSAGGAIRHAQNRRVRADHPLP